MEEHERQICTSEENIEFKKEKKWYDQDGCGDNCCVGCDCADCRCDYAIQLVGCKNDIDICLYCESAKPKEK